VLREIFAEWGHHQISLGRLKDWKTATSTLDLDLPVQLWMDSTDFPLTGARSVSRRDSSWSYKCNSPGARFMYLMDGRGRTRKLWGGYSPKLYDGDFLQVQADWIRKYLKGAGVVADQHFRWGVENFKKDRVNFHVAPKKPGKKSLKKLTKSQQKYRAQVLQIRHRVEHPFGQIDTKFKSLKHPFAEGPKQLEYLVFFATGVLNYEIK